MIKMEKLQEILVKYFSKEELDKKDVYNKKYLKLFLDDKKVKE